MDVPSTKKASALWACLGPEEVLGKAKESFVFKMVKKTILEKDIFEKNIYMIVEGIDKKILSQVAENLKVEMDDKSNEMSKKFHVI